MAGGRNLAVLFGLKLTFSENDLGQQQISHWLPGFEVKPGYSLRHSQLEGAPKRRQGGNYLRLVWPQLAVIVVTGLAIGYGFFALVFQSRGTPAGVAMNAFWGGYNISMLLPIVRAAVFRPPKGWAPRPPAFLLARP